MKKTTLFAVMLAMTASCTVSEIDSIKGTTAPVITASYENNGTKTAITTDDEGVGTIWWKPADEINVFYGTTSIHYVSKNTENATTVAFGTTDIIGSTESAQENIWGLYPYDENAVCDGESVTTTIPSSQKGVAGTFDDDIFTSLAHSTSTVMTFYNVLGGIKFSLSRVDIQSITFKGNNNEDIAGTVKLEMDANGKPVTEITEGVKTITLTPKEGTTFASNTNYYIVLLPTVLEEGFTMTFETETEIGTFEYTEKSIEIKRSVFSKKENIDSYATFESKASEHEYVDLGIRKSHLDNRITPDSKYERKIVFANCNIGAEHPQDFGYYFRWGELYGWKIQSNGYNRVPIISATQYDKDGSALSSVWSSETFSDSYCLSNDLQKKDFKGKTDLICNETVYGDAATYNWGLPWTTPDETLLDAVFFATPFTNKTATREIGSSKYPKVTLNYTYTSRSGVKGVLVENQTLGTSIFLPASGACYKGEIDYGADSTPLGDYMSSTPYLIGSNSVCYFLEFSPSGIGVGSMGNFYGYTIRPIAELTLSDEVPEPIEIPSVGNVEIQSVDYRKATVSSTLLSDGNAITECGFYYGTSQDNLSDKVKVAGYPSSDFSKELSLYPGTTYYIKAYATNEAGSVESEVVSFTTLAVSGTINGHEWVDIGIRKSHFDSSVPPGSEADRRIVFATQNIGADSNNLGYYFRENELFGWKYSDDPTTYAGTYLSGTNLKQMNNDGTIRQQYYAGYPGLFNGEEHEDEDEVSYSTGDAVEYYYGDGWEYMPAKLAFEMSCTSNYYHERPELVTKTFTRFKDLTLIFEFQKGVFVIKNNDLVTKVKFPMCGYLSYGRLCNYANGTTAYWTQSLSDGRTCLYIGSERWYDEDYWEDYWRLDLNWWGQYNAIPIRAVAELPIK